MGAENSTDTHAAGVLRRRAPPYTSFKTILTFIEDQQQHGVPSQIDRSVLPRFSGAVGTQLIGALKFLGLIGEDQSVQPELFTMVEAYGTDGWQLKLLELLERAYAPLMEQDLGRMTPAQFHETFKALYPAKDAVVRKCEVFFLNAARAAGVPINPRIGKPRTSRLATGQRRLGASAGTPRKKRSGAEEKPPRLPPEAQIAKPLEYQLVDLLKDPDIEEDQRNAIFTLVSFLSSRAKKESPDGK